MCNPVKKLDLSKKDLAIGAAAAVVAGVGGIAVSKLLSKDAPCDDACDETEDDGGEPEPDELEGAAADLANAQVDETENHFVPMHNTADADQTQV